MTFDADLCVCGSGLRRGRCCSLDTTSQPPPDAAYLSPLIESAVHAYQSGADAAAERICLEVLELAPGQAVVLWMLSRLRDAQGARAAAEALVTRIVALDPNNASATQDLALRLLARGALVEAEHHARNAVRITPDDAISHNLLAMVLTELQQPLTGEFHYRRALALSGTRDPIMLANLAWCLKLQGRIKEARALYRESVAAAPEISQTLFGWARLEEADRNFDQASKLLARAESISPNQPNLLLLRAVLAGRRGNPETALAVLEDVAEGHTDGLGPEETLEKGRLLDRLGRYDAAFAAFEDGKAALRTITGHSYDAAQAERLAGRLVNFFTEARLALLPKAGVRMDVAQPLFILGFPRSGTTLMEQSLTAHSGIVAGDELPFVTETVELMPRLLFSPMPYPEALAELWMGDRFEGLDELRDRYLQHARRRGLLKEGGAYFTDKMPLNEFHLGLIALMFPNSPLVHVIRHPLDTVLSCFSNLLTHGFGCAYGLDTAAKHFALTSDLVAHYRSQMTLRYLPVRYEDMVADHEGQVRRVLAFLDLPFEAACLRPDENRRYARTASYAQVSEPVYDRSRERWRRYRRHLEPIIPILLPTIQRLGYSVD